MELLKVGANRGDVIERVRALRVARQLGNLPGRQVGKDRARELLALGAELADFFRYVDGLVGTKVPELLELGLELGDRLFEVEKVNGHGSDPPVQQATRRAPRGRGRPAAHKFHQGPFLGRMFIHRPQAYVSSPCAATQPGSQAEAAELAPAGRP